MPAKAGIQSEVAIKATSWIPAFAGMTKNNLPDPRQPRGGAGEARDAGEAHHHPPARRSRGEMAERFGDRDGARGAAGEAALEGRGALAGEAGESGGGAA